ncbi:hypothetical protein NA57DRAFT_76007 [Rhizodiscina lignyota]|uniref:Uncharacterized protein n=1 Tax=Rhizodiscina lignyota TaxID=1504668 RepID=A0A9P4IGA4_9PEZI|nr:hypothetical protein NA57DRAFT_76007 [Rhizodiscina lignyota]
MGSGGDSAVTHTGRGGAGNIKPKSPSIKPIDLSTPTLKQSTYTTGRGGTGNMARNDPDHPEIARAAQDVEAPRATGKTSTEANFHVGRGGAANVVRSSEDSGATQRSGSKERAAHLVDKGKEMLGLKK